MSATTPFVPAIASDESPAGFAACAPEDLLSEFLATMHERGLRNCVMGVGYQ